MDGVALAKQIKTDIRKWANGLSFTPGLAVIMVGDDPASKTYVAGKVRDCAECGFHSEEFAFTEDVSESELITSIDWLNDRPDIHGILVQLPLPAGINRHRIINAIGPKKDVVCLHPRNVANNVVHQSRGPTPCTPAGIMRLFTGIPC